MKRVLSKSANIYSFTLPPDRKGLLGKVDPTRLYDIRNNKKTTLSIEQVCNQFIHSYVFQPYVPTKNTLLGIFVSSDRESKEKLYYVPLEIIIGLLFSVAKNKPISLKVNIDARNGDRKIHLT